MSRKITNQITIHFNESNKKILDAMKQQAEQNFRTTEQQILFVLNNAYQSMNSTEGIELPDPPAEIPVI